MLLHSNEPFRGSVDSRREQYQQYYTLLDDVKRLTELWNETQNKWIFLRSALANLNVTDDNQSNLKDIHVKFIEIDENFRVKSVFFVLIGVRRNIWVLFSIIKN